MNLSAFKIQERNYSLFKKRIETYFIINLQN